MASPPPDVTVTGAPDPNQPVALTNAMAPGLSQPVNTNAPPTAVSQVKGPFGSTGTLGSVLGILGDIVLTNAGLPAQYLPKLHNAHEADAVADFASNPSQAIQNLTKVSGLPTAQAYEDNQSNDALRKAQIAQAGLTSRISLAKLPGDIAEANNKVVLPYKQLAGTATDKNAGAISNLIKSRLLGQGLDPADYGFPDTADPASLKSWALSGATVAEQGNLAQGADVLAQTIAHDAATQKVAQQNADAATTTAGARVSEAGTSATNAGTNASRQKTYQQSVNQQRENINSLIANRVDLAGKRKNNNAPPVGYKNPNGLTFQGGDPHNIDNWQ